MTSNLVCPMYFRNTSLVMSYHQSPSLNESSDLSIQDLVFWGNVWRKQLVSSSTCESDCPYPISNVTIDEQYKLTFDFDHHPSFPGIASVASFTLNIESSTGLPTTVFGSLFQIGWAFAIGIAFAIITWYDIPLRRAPISSKDRNLINPFLSVLPQVEDILTPP